MISFEGWTVPSDFKSDGCTFAPDKWFGNINLKPACVLHDFLRRHICHYTLEPSEADKVFRRHLIKLGAPKSLARLYWLGVKIMRPWFTKTSPLPKEWAAYGRFK